MRKQAGFTIIEIMIITVIIGILAALVLPSIKQNAIQAKMSEALLAFAPCRNAVTELYLSGGELPSPGNWGCEVVQNATTYVDSIAVGPEGTITISLHGFNDLRINTFDVTLAPLDASGNLPDGPGAQIKRWRCGFPPDGTNLSPQYLPSTCRGG